MNWTSLISLMPNLDYNWKASLDFTWQKVLIIYKKKFLTFFSHSWLSFVSHEHQKLASNKLISTVIYWSLHRNASLLQYEGTGVQGSKPAPNWRKDGAKEAIKPFPKEAVYELVTLKRWRRLSRNGEPSLWHLTLGRASRDSWDKPGKVSTSHKRAVHAGWARFSRSDEASRCLISAKYSTWVFFFLLKWCCTAIF